MHVARVSAGVPFLTGLVWGIFFSWSPGQTQVDEKEGARGAAPPKPSVRQEMVLRDVGRAAVVVMESPAERLRKAEMELYQMKRERHRLQKSLQAKALHLRVRRPLVAPRRPCT